jgi:hypothetical protein
VADDVLTRLLSAAAAIETRVGIRACVIGGVARGVWAERRTTLDVDVLVDTEDLAPIIARAHDLGVVTVDSEVAALASAGMTRLRLPDELTGETRLDVISRSHEYYGRVIARSILVEALGVHVRVASAEDVILLKVLADRPQDRADVDAIIQAQGVSLDRAVIHQEASALGIDLPAPLR